MIEPGLTCTLEAQVGEDDTAIALGSGDLPVLATPRMVAWMENAAMSAVAAQLEPAETTVGTRIEVTHVKAVPIGGVVRATALSTEVDRRRIEFRIEVRDANHELVGEGTHTRFVVDRARFLDRL